MQPDAAEGQVDAHGENLYQALLQRQPPADDQVALTAVFGENDGTPLRVFQPPTCAGHQVGMGIDINRYRRRCRAGGVEPEIIAAAIAYLPIVTGLAPPLSLAPWDRNPAIYEQCVGRAYHDQEATPTNDVTIKTVPSPTSSGDVVGVEKQRAEQRKQLEQLRREASP